MKSTRNSKFAAALALLTLPTAQTFAAPEAKVIDVTAGSCAKINAAINSLPESGGTVRLGPGIFLCEAAVVIKKDNVSLIGAGRDKTLIKAAPKHAIPVVIIGETKNAPTETKKWGIQFYPIRQTKNVRVSDMTIDGSRWTNLLRDQKNLECYDPQTTISQTCDNDGGRFIRNNGLTIRGAEHVRVKNIDFKANYSGGVVLEKRSSDIVIENFTAVDNFFDGFAGYETSKSLFKNFEIKKNAFSAISVDLGFEGNKFENGHLHHNGDNGVFSANVGYNIYDNMKVENNRNFPFFVVGHSYEDKELGRWLTVEKSCDGNQIINSQISGGPNAAIGLGDGCKQTVIERNTITHPKQCIQAGEGSSGSIANNDCRS